MKLLQIVTTAFISAFLLYPISEVNTCASGYEGDEARLLLFNPNVITDKTLFPFFYNFNYLNDASTEIKTDQALNIDEWFAYFKGKVSKSYIKEVLYEMSPDDFLLQITSRKNTISSVFKENEKINEVFKFLKKNEFAHFNNPDPWAEPYYDNKQKIFIYDINFTEKLLEEGLILYEKIKSDSFLRKRVGFQLLRIYRFQENYENAKQFIFLFHDRNNPSVIDAWAWMHEAALIFKENRLDAYYLIAQVFCISDDKRRPAYIAYTRNYSTQDSIVNMAKSTYERASIMAFNTIDNPGKVLNSIKRVYQTDSECKFLPLLISREIAKLDNWLKGYELTGFTNNHRDFNEAKEYLSEPSSWEDYSFQNEANQQNENLKEDLLYGKELVTFLKKASISSNRKQVDFYNIAIAHLLNLVGEAGESRTYLNKIGDSASTEILLQKQIESLIVSTNNSNGSLALDKDEIANALYFLNKHKHLLDDPNKIISSIELYLSNEFRKRNDIVIAAWLYYKSYVGKKYYDTHTNYLDYFGKQIATKEDYNWGKERNDKVDISDIYLWKDSFYSYISYYDRNASPQHVQELIKLKSEQKSKLGKLYQYCYPEAWAEDEVYFDLLGTLEFRKGNFENAAKAYEKIDDQFWQEKYSFKYYLNANPFVNTYALDKTEGEYKISKTKTARRMTDLEALSKSNNSSDNLYALAVGYFNTSTYDGNNWMMYNYGKSSGEFNEIYTSKSHFENTRQDTSQDYYDYDKVIALLEQAEKRNPNQETAAKILFLRHTIDRLLFYQDHSDYGDTATYVPVFMVDFDKYKETKYYNQVLPCLLENDYIQ